MAIVDLLMPKMGESIMEATILKWNKKPGDSVQQDESLLDIATDKVDSEVPSTAAGVLKEILFEENAVVPVGAVIARIETNVHSGSLPDNNTIPESPAGSGQSSTAQSYSFDSHSRQTIPEFEESPVSEKSSAFKTHSSPLTAETANG